MKKILTVGFAALLMTLNLTSPSYSQEGKETASKKQTQSEGVSGSENYVIGPEDVLQIHVWREDVLSRTIPVRMDGKISLPLINDVEAAGLTVQQLKEVLTEKLKKFVENPNVSVMIVEANSYKVYVSGQVRTPGIFRLRSETSILQIIPMAGGFTDWANPKKIVIIRKEGGKEKRISVNYKKIVDGNPSASNIILKAGDTVIVP
jgi:polysaccharide export outer membrane protein